MLKLLTIVFFLCLALFFVGAKIISPIDSNDSKIQNFIVTEGENADQIASGLSDVGLIRSTFVFKLIAKIFDLDRNFKSGDYRLSKSLSAPVIAYKLTSGGNVSVQLLEGWNSLEIAEKWEMQGLGKSADFLQSVNDLAWRSQYDFLAELPAKQNLEGYLFPDTYELNAGAKPNDLIKKMLDNFSRKLDAKMLAEIKRRGLTVFEVMTMASIVEKEAGGDCLNGGTNVAMVADIFYRRLKMSMALQSDATVNYITGLSKIQPTWSETRTNSPYNTYLNRGLPPGPISNPGLCAITATVYPKTNPYLYFLTSKDGHNFYYASSYEEHLANKYKHLD